MYYIPAEVSGVAHCAPCDDALSGLASVFMMAYFGVALVIFTCVGVQRYGGRKTDTLRKMTHSLVNHYTVLNKLKILVGFFQIVIKVDRVHSSAHSIQVYLIEN
jgi:acid phosphatase family membrane protein YuiD